MDEAKRRPFVNSYFYFIKLASCWARTPDINAKSKYFTVDSNTVKKKKISDTQQTPSTKSFLSPDRFFQSLCYHYFILYFAEATYQGDAEDAAYLTHIHTQHSSMCGHTLQSPGRQWWWPQWKPSECNDPQFAHPDSKHAQLKCHRNIQRKNVPLFLLWAVN